MEMQDVPSFGGGDERPESSGGGGAASSAMMDSNGNGATGERQAEAEDELFSSASIDKVQEMTEQLAEFLVKFNAVEQRAILAPFLSGIVVVSDPAVDTHIDEARRFLSHYLAIYSECERDLILEKWRPAFDTSSLSSATESLTPSVTPPGSVTPTAVTPREFLSARREANEMYHTHSPCETDQQWPV